MGTVMTQQESNEMGIRLIHGYGKEWEFTSWKLEQWKCKKKSILGHLYATRNAGVVARIWRQTTWK